MTSVVIGALAMLWASSVMRTGFSDARPLVEAAAKSEASATYVADGLSSTYYKGRRIETKTRIHHCREGERTDYLTGPLSGSSMVQRNGVCYLSNPAARSSRIISSCARGDTRARLKTLLSNHVAVKLREEKVAGRAAVVITLMPKAGEGPSKTMWLDKETHVPLRTDDYDSDGHLRSSTRFTNVRYMDRMPSSILGEYVTARQGAQDSDALVDRRSLSKLLGFSVSETRYVSRGYTLDSYRLFRCACACGHKSAHIVYSNGMDVISVFETAATTKCASRDCPSRPTGPKGCIMEDNEQAGMAVVSRDDKTVAVVGGVPTSELKKIAESVP